MFIHAHDGLTIDILHVLGGDYSGTLNVNNFGQLSLNTFEQNSTVTFLKSFVVSTTLAFIQLGDNATLLINPNSSSQIQLLNDVKFTGKSAETNAVVKTNGNLIFNKTATFQFVDLTGIGSIVVGENGSLSFNNAALNPSKIVLSEPHYSTAQQSLFSGSNVTFNTDIISFPPSPIISVVGGINDICQGSCGHITGSSTGPFSFVVTSPPPPPPPVPFPIPVPVLVPVPVPSVPAPIVPAHVPVPAAQPVPVPVNPPSSPPASPPVPVSQVHTGVGWGVGIAIGLVVGAAVWLIAAFVFKRRAGYLPVDGNL